MSSYKFAPGIDSNSFVFPTDQGWLYSVSFPNRTSFFQGNDILENGGLSFEIIFERSALDQPVKGIDSLVQPTILSIIGKQFDGQGVLPIYFFLCDMQDRQEAARAKLFNRWYETCELEDWELFNFVMESPNEGDYTFYAGLFIHPEHPNFPVVPDAFEQFLELDISNGKLVVRR